MGDEQLFRERILIGLRVAALGLGLTYLVAAGCLTATSADGGTTLPVNLVMAFVFTVAAAPATLALGLVGGLFWAWPTARDDS
ncbi:hypothetical protein [Actinoplanes sp. DH11]|uniref:hypothetical protein n=1 Tax=Actinoplanes sp. DH11 TaxID=2857011 RepID=UPI001E4427AA|nr:hypothetical protein [Actinoplanes sp. DH11]